MKRSNLIGKELVWMPQTKFFRMSFGIISILLMIYLGSLVDWVFKPIVVLFQSLSAPIILSGVLFYLLRPIVKIVSRWIPKSIAILSLYLSIVLAVTLFIIIVGPELQAQFNSLVNNVPHFMNDIQKMLVNLQYNEYVARFQPAENFSLEQIAERLIDYVNDTASTIGSSLASFIGFIANVVIVLVIIPFVLYYMLKEGEKAPNAVLKLLPEKQQREGERILADMDTALSSYIQGQIIVSVCVGILCYIGFLIIGLEYPLILALVAMFTNVIPFIGPWIGTFPSVVVGFLDSPFMALLVVIVVVVVQQIESNLISPQVMGRKLDIHPLTIILLLLVASRFAGLIGLLLAVPTYAVGKVIVLHSYRLWKLRKNGID